MCTKSWFYRLKINLTNFILFNIISETRLNHKLEVNCKKKIIFHTFKARSLSKLVSH